MPANDNGIVIHTVAAGDSIAVGEEAFDEEVGSPVLSL
jgi:hypothetical protein